jgi:hypothetical protein
MSPNFAGATLSWGLYFWWYSVLKSWQFRDGKDMSSAEYFLAAAEAGELTNLPHVLLVRLLWMMQAYICILSIRVSLTKSPVLNLSRDPDERVHKSNMGGEDPNVPAATWIAGRVPWCLW